MLGKKTRLLGKKTTFLFMKFLVGVLCKICKFNLQNQYCRNICTNVIAKWSSDEGHWPWCFRRRRTHGLIQNSVRTHHKHAHTNHTLIEKIQKR